jgi:hypothetical protein
VLIAHSLSWVSIGRPCLGPGVRAANRDPGGIAVLPDHHLDHVRQAAPLLLRGRRHRELDPHRDGLGLECRYCILAADVAAKCTADTLQGSFLTRNVAMTRHYSTNKFFRQSPNALLARYFKRHKVLLDFDFTKLKEGNPDTLCAAWLKLPAEKRNRMDAQFQEIFAMSCEAGTKAIIDEARYWTVTVNGGPIEPFIDWISGLKNHYDRAFQTFLKYPNYWIGATRFHYADTLSWWRKRKGLPSVSAQSDKASLNQLAELISSYFHAEGNGVRSTFRSKQAGGP